MSSIAAISLRSISRNLTRHFYALPIRGFSANAVSGDSVDDNESKNTNESNDDFEWSFRGLSENNDLVNDSFLKKLEKLEKAGSGYGLDHNNLSDEDDSSGNFFDSLDDGMDGELKKVCLAFEDYDADEIEKDDEFSFRPDMDFIPGGTYTPKDLDLRKPGVTNRPERKEFKVTTEEVLKKADFRNVRFLANFITEAGIIHKRSTMSIRAKAQRKIAREIKTARAFGLMPFTTMGTKPFAYGRSMENLGNDFTYWSSNNSAVGTEYDGGDQTFYDPDDGEKDESRPSRT